MSVKKTIFQLFKDRDEGFARQPSKQAWNRLEEKLDARAGKKTIPLYRIFSIAAAIAVIVSMFVLLAYWSGQFQGTHSLAFNGDRPEFLEDLLVNQSDPSFAEELQISKAYRAKFANFIASETELEENPSTETVETSNEPTHNSPFRIIHPKETDIAALKPVHSDQPIAGLIAAPKVVTAEEHAISSTPSNTRADALESTKLNPGFPVEIPDNNGLMSSLSWMIGVWEEQLPTGRSVEQWTQQSPQQLAGQGWLIRGDDTVFTEQMAIRSIGKDVYYYQNLQAAGGPDSFSLSGKKGTQWIFENEANTSRFILTQSGRKRFSAELKTELSSERYDSMKNISPAVNQYLNQRNALMENRAVRNLNRAD